MIWLCIRSRGFSPAWPKMSHGTRRANRQGPNRPSSRRRPSGAPSIPTDWRLSFLAQQSSAGQVCLDDVALGVKREVADRCEVVQIDEAVASAGKLDLRASKLLVLKFEFDLLHMQLVHESLG